MLTALRRSLKAKVVAVVFVSTVAALFVSTVALLLYEINNYRAFLEADLSTQADILARTSAPALQFDDPAAAAANLALLENRQSFVAAAVYTPLGEIVASYTRNDAPFEWPRVGRVDEISVDGNALTLFRPVIESGNRLGTIYLRADYDLAARTWTYLSILVTVMVLSLAVAAAISLSLAGSVMRPVRSVTRTAQRVIDERDFSLRAEKQTDDEIGVLVGAFNAMLTEVGERTAELERTNRSLQSETEIRANAEAELRAADRRKDEFLATLAHELRNPLAPLVNAVHLLKAPGGGGAARERTLGIMERQVRHLVRLVDDLLDVSRITTGKLEIRTQPVRLAEIVEGAADMMEPELRARDQSLRIELPDEDVHVLADATRLGQVIGNLLHNAVKFSDPGGRITLTVVPEAGVARIAVSDAGKGISADTMAGLFEMFAQGGTPSEHAQTGLGVGLALAKQLTALHGGTIEAESPGAGQGATFVVRIPLAYGPTPQGAQAQPASEDGIDPARVLVVDDNVDFAVSLARLLGAAGHDVRVTHDAEQALAVAGEFRPEFGLLDIGLPGIDGYELARRLRASPGAGDVTLVAISGWGQPDDVERSREAGFALHLVKPVGFEAVQDALRRLRRERTTT